MSFSNRVDTVTEDFLVPKVVDTVLKGNVFATRMLGKAKKFKSATMLFPIKWQKGISSQSFSGFDTLPTTASDTRVNMSFNPRFVATNVALPLTELAVNMTENKVLDLAAVEMESRAGDMADSVGTMLYSDGTGNSNKDLLGLGAGVDDGSSVATYGGLSRTTYTTIASTVTSSSGTLTLAKMRTLWNAISDPAQQPTAIFTTKAVFGFYESLLQPQERIYKETKLVRDMHGGTGFQTLDYMGMPVLADAKCTSGVLFMLNEDYMDFLGVSFPDAKPVKIGGGDIEGNSYEGVQGLGFSWGGWIKASNTAAVNGFIYLGGNLIVRNPGRQGKLTSITGV